MLVTRAALLLLLVLWQGPGQAEELDLDIGSGLVCDTPQQVERFVKIYEGDLDRALAQINAEAGEVVCSSETFAFILGPQVGIVRKTTAMYRIIQILVFGVFTEEGYEALEPQTYFTVGEIEQESI